MWLFEIPMLLPPPLPWLPLILLLSLLVLLPSLLHLLISLLLLLLQLMMFRMVHASDYLWCCGDVSQLHTLSSVFCGTFANNHNVVNGTLMVRQATRQWFCNGASSGASVIREWYGKWWINCTASGVSLSLQPARHWYGKRRVIDLHTKHVCSTID